MRLLLALAPLATACSTGLVSEEAFPADYGQALCQKQEECSRGFFESTYADRDHCADQWTDVKAAENEQNLNAGCEFDPEEAARCLRNLQQATCEDFYEGDALQFCADVWTCGTPEAPTDTGSSGNDTGDKGEDDTGA